MKMMSLATLGAVAATGFTPVVFATPAEAQRTVVHERTVVRHGRPHYRYRWVNRRVCHWERRYHRSSVKVCRVTRVRVRY